MGRKDQAMEAWIRVVGLPLHLWTREILKKVANSCGRFLAMDKEIALKTELRMLGGFLWVVAMAPLTAPLFS